MDKNTVKTSKSSSPKTSGLTTNSEILGLNTVESLQLVNSETSATLTQSNVANIKGIWSLYDSKSQEYYTEARNIQQYHFYELNLKGKLNTTLVLYTVSAVYAFLAPNYNKNQNLTGVILNIKPYGLTFLVQFGKNIGYDGYLTYFLNKKTKTLNYLYEVGPILQSNFHLHIKKFQSNQQTYKKKVLTLLNTLSGSTFFTEEAFPNVVSFARKHNEQPNFDLYQKEIGFLNPDTVSIIICEGARFQTIRKAFLEGKLSGETIFWGKVIDEDGATVLVAISLIQLWRSWSLLGKQYSLSPEDLIKQLFYNEFFSDTQGTYYLDEIDLKKPALYYQQITQSAMLTAQATYAGLQIPLQSKFPSGKQGK
ncbi:MAG: hypothetical protein AAFQ98_19040 [Bacteroidota bacterium]